MTQTPRETIAPDESTRFEAYAAELRDLQKHAAKGGALSRALHAKPHVGAVGELVVGELPAEWRVAVFAEPRSWPLYARFSNGSHERAHDGTADVRGVALKLVGVPGKKVIPGLEDAPTQDFLFIQVPAMPIKTPDEFLTFLRIARRGPALLVPRLIGALGFGRALSIVKGFATMPKVTSLATATFYTPVPIRFGDTAVKLSLAPVAPATLAPATGPNALREDLVARLGAGKVEYALRAQRFVDEATTPIEDASVRWPEDRSPWVELGRVVLPKQAVTSTRGAEIESLVESLSFDPWHALEALRPMGAVMRARSAAYRERRRRAVRPRSRRAFFQTLESARSVLVRLSVPEGMNWSVRHDAALLERAFVPRSPSALRLLSAAAWCLRPSCAARSFSSRWRRPRV